MIVIIILRKMADGPRPRRKLTSTQMAQANALYSHLLDLADLGARKSEVMLDREGGIRVSPIGRGVEIVLEIDRAMMLPAV